MSENIEADLWTDERQASVLEALRLIELSQKAGIRLPAQVFEQHIRTHKRVSTEMLLVHPESHKAYLVQRPSLKENPHEVYPEQFHFPGVTHQPHETIEDTFERLRRDEGLSFLTKPKLIATHETDGDGRGSRCLMLVHAALSEREPTNPKGAWYYVNEIEQLNLVHSHRTFLYPDLRAHKFVRPV